MNESMAIVKKKQKVNPRHGVYSWLRKGRVNPSIRGHKELQRYLMSLERELTELQGSGGMTAAKEIIIKSTVEAFGAVLLASMYCKRAGILRPDMARRGVIEFQPVLGKQFLSFMNTIRQNLMALGLDSRKGEEILDLGKYIELKDREKAAQADKEKSRTKARKGNRKAGQGQAEAVDGGDQGKTAGSGIVPLRGSSEDISGEDRAGIDCSSEGGQGQDSGPEGIGQPESLQRKEGR